MRITKSFHDGEWFYTFDDYGKKTVVTVKELEHRRDYFLTELKMVMDRLSDCAECVSEDAL